MSISKRNIRGAQNIPTFSGKDSVSFSYKTYMRVTCLEIERTRLLKEKARVIERLEEVGRRVQEIEAEKAALLQGLTGQNRSNVVTAPVPVGKAGEPSPGTTCIKIRY